MARSQAGTKQATSTPVAPSAPTDINALKAERDRIDALLKAERERTKGKVSAIGFDAENGVWQLDITPGAEPTKAKDGRVYAFTVDPFEFTHNGVTYSVGAIYALPKKAKGE